MKTIISVLAISLFFTAAYSQNMSVSSVDAETYDMYLKKEWKKIIKTEKQARKSGISFYYLNYRTAIAYYEMKKYTEAVKYFEKIYMNDKENETVAEYLYYSYLLSGRNEDARLLASTFKKDLKEKLDIEAEYPFIKALFFTTKRDFNEDYSYIPQNDEEVEQISMTEQQWYNLSFEHYFGNRLKIFHGFSHSETENNIRTVDLSLPSLFTEDVNQNEYYFSLNYHLAKGFNITGALHYLNTSYKAIDPVPIVMGRRITYRYLYSYSEKSYIAFLKADKFFSRFKISAESSISDLSDNVQIQSAVRLKIYPFGNNGFYTETSGILLTERESGLTEYSTVFRQSAGFKFLKYSYFDAFVSAGYLRNYNEYNAFTVYNDPDKSKLRAGSVVNFGFAKGKFNIFLNYQYNLKENIFEINGNEQKIEYTNMFVSGGIKWYFKKY